MATSFAILFAKPHVADCKEVIAHAHSLIDNLRFEVASFRHVTLNGQALFRNYLPHTYFSASPFADHVQYLKLSGCRMIEENTNQSPNVHLRQGTIQGAEEAIRRHNITPSDLHLAWERANRLVRVQAGYQMKQITFSNSREIWVVNGYFPYRLKLYDSNARRVPVWLLALPANTSVPKARESLLGDHTSGEATLRGYLAENSERLRVHVDAFNNGFHMSDSEAACIRETAIWFPEWLRRQPILSEISAASVLSDEVLASTLSDKDASFRLAESTSKTELSCTLEELLGEVL